MKPQVLNQVQSEIGLVEWLRPHEYERAEQLLADCRDLGVTRLRTGISWADYHTTAGQDWYQWLLPRLAQGVELLPCIHYTPPSLGVVPKTSAPPRRLKDYADFIDVMITEFGEYFEWIELWNEPNNLSDWDWRIDPLWHQFFEMIGGAAYWVQQRGKKTVLGGMAPVDLNWLCLAGERGVLAYIDAVGIHGFPGTWEFEWTDWSMTVASVRELIYPHQPQAEVWITETGFSTWKHDDRGQIEAFLQAIAAPVERLYWYAAHDLHPDESTQDGLHSDSRHYHMGLKQANNTSKLLYRLWADGGLSAVQQTFQLTQPTQGISDSQSDRYSLITGGAGFIGTNLAQRLLSKGESVLILDNLSRPGVEKNLTWLREQYGDRLKIQQADVRNLHAVRQAVQQASQVFHFAAQVAVTTSLTNPIEDFEVNARGTLNLLEALRSLDHPPPLVFTSTNKVYGGLTHLHWIEQGKRYELADPKLRAYGVSEAMPLDFHSPYGCSKGVADQYILDYARTFGLPAVVFRMSCIYGPHQLGTEDQGWVAHFLIRALEGKPITLYGDGKQVRDILFVEDLVDALLMAQANMPHLAGQTFNMGGGPTHATSLLELIDLIAVLQGEKPQVDFDAWRPGDQRYYTSDTRKFQAATGWSPQIGVQQGVERLYQWLLQSRGLVPALPKILTTLR
jgi:CDP-paratose 2-epimerase